MKHSVYGVMVIIVLLLSGTALAEEAVSPQATENPWDGIWTDDNSTLTIEQNGSEVSGICEPINPETGEWFLLSGTVSENGVVLNGTISYTGTMELTMSEDLMDFNATVSVDRIGNNTEDYSYPINATRQESPMDQENLWTGTWKTQQSLFNITQNGTDVWGTNHRLVSPEEGGEFNGTVSEDETVASIRWEAEYDLPLCLAEDGLSIYEIDCGEEEISNGELCLNMTKVE